MTLSCNATGWVLRGDVDLFHEDFRLILGSKVVVEVYQPINELMLGNECDQPGGRPSGALDIAGIGSIRTE